MKRAKRSGGKSVKPKAGPRAKAPKSAKKAAARKTKAKPAARSTKAGAQDWTLAGRVVAAPKLSDAKVARKRVADWLGSAPSASAKAIASLFAANRNLSTLLEGIGESSPFLWELMTADAARLVRIFRSDPDDHFRALLSETAAATARTSDEAEAMRLLRQMKAEGALLIALCDIGGVWPIMRCTQALTELADTAVASAVRFLLNDAAKAGRFTPLDRSQPDKASGYIVLAMGKMGAGELNYSSDIDLIVLYDAQSAPLAKNLEPAPFFVRLTQRLVKLLQERTGDGYVFRTDLRLRPDPASTAIAISTEAAMSYYESSGQNWERAAMIKARPCAGDIAAGEKLIEALAPFIWRKYLDFAAVADVQTMKQQIHAYRGHGEIAVEGHNIKLGRGGIREVEFFAQTQQLIAGGRNPALRDRETLPTLDKLVDDGWVDAPTRDDMREAYLFLRKVEHRLQMVNDDQTQTLPDDPAAMERLAHFLGFEGRDAFAAELLAQLKKVQKRYGALFEATIAPDKAQLSFPQDADDKRTLDQLERNGLSHPAGDIGAGPAMAIRRISLIA